MKYIHEGLNKAVKTGLYVSFKRRALTEAFSTFSRSSPLFASFLILFFPRPILPPNKNVECHISNFHPLFLPFHSFLFPSDSVFFLLITITVRRHLISVKMFSLHFQVKLKFFAHSLLFFSSVFLHFSFP